LINIQLGKILYIKFTALRLKVFLNSIDMIYSNRIISAFVMLSNHEHLTLVVDTIHDHLTIQ